MSRSYDSLFSQPKSQGFGTTDNDAHMTYPECYNEEPWKSRGGLLVAAMSRVLQEKSMAEETILSTTFLTYLNKQKDSTWESDMEVFFQACSNFTNKSLPNSNIHMEHKNGYLSITKALGG